jgi:hypothetical protein
VNLNKILCFIYKKNKKLNKMFTGTSSSKQTPHCQYQAFPAVVAFKQGLPIFHFSF